MWLDFIRLFKKNMLIIICFFIWLTTLEMYAVDLNLIHFIILLTREFLSRRIRSV